MELTDEQLEKLRLQDERPCEAFRAEKFQRESGKMWDLFYKRNETRFFKDRHWTTREFSELIAEEGSKRDQDHQKRKLFEIGCGVGNFLFPLIEEQINLFVHACDISPRAIQMVKDNPLYKESFVNAFQCDITQDCCFESIERESVDIASLIFVLSSIRPEHFSAVLRNIHKVLKPNGLLIFRDYSVNDMAMFRFKKGSKLGTRHYLRQDGTSTYFFTLEEMKKLCQSVGFEVEVNEVIERRTINKKEDIDVIRLFLQGKYRKVS